MRQEKEAQLHLESLNSNNMEEIQRTFIEISQEIADNFLSTIVFIDECAYKQAPENDNDFDAKVVTDAFAKKGKICTVFAPEKASDLDNICSMLFKADAIVLDWRLNIEDDNAKSSTDFETDADTDDERGKYTIPIIQKIVENAGKEKVKLIVVYTGETDLKQIGNDIAASLGITSTSFEIACHNVKIVIRAKSTKSGKSDKYKYLDDEYKQQVVDYSQLPDLIVEQFAVMVNGILPNFALQAITEIRNSTSKILGVFSKDLDPAFLGHYVSIPDCNDTFPVLSKAFGTAVTNLIDTSGSEYELWMEKWIDDNIKEHEIKICDKNIKCSAENLKKIIKSSKTFETKYKESFGVDVNQYNEDSYKRKATDLFCSQDSDLSNYKWSRLLQYNNLFSSSKVHKLTLGTIVKCKGKDDADWKYLLCIQQRCDSVRIQSQEMRTFLFLPLVKGIKGEAVVVGENDHYIVNNKTYSIELHEFSPSANDAHIAARQIENNEYIFQDKNGINYIWVAELNEMFAQSIASAYASQLSRVGIDNSEWLRLVGKINKK